MTFNDLKTLTSALLRGDTEIPPNEEFLALLKYAFLEVANGANALKLITAKDSNDRILRLGPGSTFVRMPKTPKEDNEELDVDEELCPALARYIASYLSNTAKRRTHAEEAEKILRLYNQNIVSYFEELEAKGELPEGLSIYGIREY